MLPLNVLPLPVHDLYFKTTCNIRPHFLRPMGGLKIEGHCRLLWRYALYTYNLQFQCLRFPFLEVSVYSGIPAMREGDGVKLVLPGFLLYNSIQLFSGSRTQRLILTKHHFFYFQLHIYKTELAGLFFFRSAINMTLYFSQPRLQ